MADNGYIWNSDFGRKPKKDPYDNPMGFTGKPSGITSDAEAINRQSRETDNAIGAEALRQRKADPVRIPEAEPVRPAPAPAIEPQPEKTDKPDINGTNGTNGNRFGYADKAYGTGGDETAKRDREYEDNLKMDSGNEGFIVPPVPLSREKNESYPDERQKLEEHSANEGFTTGDSESYRQLEAESQKRIENLTAFLGTFLEGNEKEERFANGLPAPGEAHQSIKDMDDSTFGQGLRDLYHSGARGMYELGNRGLSGMSIMDDEMKKPYQFLRNPVDPYFLWNMGQKTFGNGSMDTQYEIYRQKQALREKAREHENRLSNDNREASIKNPGYLGVKEAGNFVRNLPSMLMAAGIVGQMGAQYELYYQAIAGAMDEYTGRYDREMDKWMGKPEKEMMAYPEYVEAKRQGKSEEEARFRVGDPRVKKGSLISLLTGAVKGVLTHGIGKVTRDGKEGIFTKLGQDHASSRVMDELWGK